MNFYSLLDKDINSFDDIFKSLDSDYKVKEIKNYTYVSFNKEGISFCFKDRVLECIYLYNEGIQGFNFYKSELPYGLNFKFLNRDIISYLGDSKTKGSASGIWISYPHLGLELTFLNKVWEDSENPIIFISLFKPEVKALDYCSVCLNNLTQKPLKCSQCDYVAYCSEKCKSVHLPYHNKICQYNK
jgi:hypothetical protein